MMAEQQGRTERVWMIAVALALPMVGSAWAQFTPDAQTLFLAHFDTGLHADYAKGRAEATGTGALTLGQEGRFGEAVRLTGRQTLPKLF